MLSDANTAKETGFYSTNSSTINTPYAGYFNIYVLKYGNSDVSQIAIDINNNRMFTRTWHDGTTWTSWKEYVEGGSVSVSSVSFINFTGTASDYECFRNGDVITLAFKFTIATSTSSNAQINTSSLPLFGKTFRMAHGQWYDNTDDQSGDITGHHSAGIRFSRAGVNTNFSDRVNHNMSVVITYIVS